MLSKKDSAVSLPPKEPPTLTLLSTEELLRSYLVYSLCSFPTLVDASPALLQWAWTTSIPGVKWLATAVIRATFFQQFCGGETLEELRGTLDRLASRRVGALIVYSVEAEPSEGGHSGAPEAGAAHLHTDLVEEVYRSVDFATSLSQAGTHSPAVALKVSGLLKDPAALRRVSDAIVANRLFTDQSHNAVTALDGALSEKTLNVSSHDAFAMYELLEAMRKIGHRAKEGRTKVVIDAEWTAIQPAIDLLSLELSREFNHIDSPSAPPTFYITLQTSLRRSEPFLRAMLADAHARNYSLGVKVVRGAYVTAEHKAANVGGFTSPAWSTKLETDQCFDTCSRLLVDALAAQVQGTGAAEVGAIFATHNRSSVSLIFDLLRDQGLAHPQPRADESSHTTLVLRSSACNLVSFAQLAGMADDVTDKLANHLIAEEGSPTTLKYLPYGSFDKVMPYLVRRAQENKSIMSGEGEGGGGAAEEKKRIRRELRRRVASWWDGQPSV
ncbi:FAD-linked oxidoreductase [Jaminaea rosea]|uniref:Proline dehydrogenase n=1 Tax=Jaminaea rosea TaxID=1569628 RepID=A0A316UMD5_9BASI|nr:FAD-linked oxidoreductase [Jaminaea rosea]PWN25541.1 FAD-linked oxidoreductase [Jaminaea rosea]